MLTLRPYQQAAIASIYGYFQNNKGNPCLMKVPAFVRNKSHRQAF